MDERYWDRVAPDYVAQVHDTLASDRTGVITARLDQFASPRKTAADFGCGVGHYLPALASRFKYIFALDHSQRLLDEAAAVHEELHNVTYRKADLSRPLRKWTPVSFGICMNVLITPDHDLRLAMLRTIHRALSPSGGLLAVVPSLESALFTDVRLVEWNMRDGMTPRQALREGMEGEPGLIGPVAAGVVDSGGEPTKHYLREEAMLMFRNVGFEIENIEKAEYTWDEEFDAPPRWMREPYPWHWLLVCKRR
jgi:SAM-dependent methyltransferase